MPIRVRLPGVEQFFGVRLSAITEEHLRGLRGVEENGQLEFKQVTDAGFPADPSEFAKDVCAMANGKGGLIVYGITDADGCAGDLAPFTQPTGETRQRLANILRSHCRPAPPFDVAEVPSKHDPGKVYVLVAIARSADAPHARLKLPTEKGTKDNEIWYQFPFATRRPPPTSRKRSWRPDTRHGHGPCTIARTNSAAT